MKGCILILGDFHIDSMGNCTPASPHETDGGTFEGYM